MNLIEKYKERIAELQVKINQYETNMPKGSCRKLTGEIQAYNAVISDLQDPGPENLSPRQAYIICKTQEALIGDDIQEAFHWIYQLISPDFAMEADELDAAWQELLKTAQLYKQEEIKL